MFLKFSILLFLFLNFLEISFGQSCDSKGIQKLDSTFAKLLVLGGSGRTFPEDKQGQLRKFCDQTTEYIQDIDKYKNKCMAQMPKQVTGVIVYSVRNTINQYCKKDSKKLTDLVASTPCANKAKRVYDQCYTNMIDAFQGANNAEDKLKIPHTCCEYYKFHECIREKPLKDKHCNEKSAEIISNFIRDLFGNVVDLICGDYVEGSDKCETLGKAPKKKKSDRRTKSFMIPLIDNLSSIPEA